VVSNEPRWSVASAYHTSQRRRYASTRAICCDVGGMPGGYTIIVAAFQ
jgi:hypothetical protein